MSLFLRLFLVTRLCFPRCSLRWKEWFCSCSASVLERSYRKRRLYSRLTPGWRWVKSSGSTKKQWDSTQSSRKVWRWCGCGPRVSNDSWPGVTSHFIHEHSTDYLAFLFPLFNLMKCNVWNLNKNLRLAYPIFTPENYIKPYWCFTHEKHQCKKK